MRDPSAFRFGAIVQEGGVLFQIWCQTSEVELVLENGPGPALELRRDGVRQTFAPGLGAGARYGYRIGGQGPFPDPASRSQPDGVHGLSEVVDPAYDWTDSGFTPQPWPRTVIYELHCGAFTPQGTFAAATERLPDLVDLGVTAVELMPLADAPGRRNWGYDGVALYAPNRNYGRPEELRALVNRAHQLGLSIYLDVVYNHFGPDGAYHRLFHPGFYAQHTKTPWGDGLNFDEIHSETTRAFFLENALHWLEEYHIDGFRLDATHTIQDAGPVHFLAEFAAVVHRRATQLGRVVRVVAEDERNLIKLTESTEVGGYGLDAVWADDFHHQIRRALAGDCHGYFADYTGASADIARTVANGWFYEGQHSPHHNAPRGTPTGGLARERFVVCIQNHDQIGNRARGERLNHQVPAERLRAASALLLLAPETPLLFMGQEWAATAPFQFFTDHNPQLGPLVSEGRRREFAHFPEFSEETARATIPDPQADETFLRCKLNWDERTLPAHAAMLRWYRRLLALRREIRSQGLRCTVREDTGLIILGWSGAGRLISVCVSLAGTGACAAVPGRLLLTSEDAEYAFESASPPAMGPHGRLVFERPGCAIFLAEEQEDAR